MIFELPICDTFVLSSKRVAPEGNYQFNGATFVRQLRFKRNRIDAAEHLIYKMHHLFYLDLVKKISGLLGAKTSRAPIGCSLCLVKLNDKR